MQNTAPCSRRALTTVSCGAQLVHMRDRSVEASLGVLERLNTWFMPSHYTVIEVKMCIIKEWGDMVTSYITTRVENQKEGKTGFSSSFRFSV